MLLKEKRIIVHKLLWQLGALHNKEAILDSYGVESTTELNDSQIDELIERLKLCIESRYNDNAELRQWRSNAITILQKLGVYNNNGDWSHVNRFMLDKRICGKLLYELNIGELKDLCRKLQAILVKKQEADKKLLLQINMN